MNAGGFREKPVPVELKRERVARPSRRMRRVCAMVHYEQTVRERGARPGRRMRRVCAGTLVHHEQTVRERVARRVRWKAAGVCGYTGAL